MLDLKLDVIDEKVDVDISIKLDNAALAGGVYMFLLDEVPLYIGEANIFLSRLSVHLYELQKNKSYFGLGELEGKHKITYIILNNELPFDPDDKRKKDENLKRVPDKNRSKREEVQNSFIEKYRPMTQKPIFYGDDKLAKLRSSKKDAMIQDVEKKNEIIKAGLEKYKEEYSEIIRIISNNEYLENYRNKQ